MISWSEMTGGVRPSYNFIHKIWIIFKLCHVMNIQIFREDTLEAVL